MPAGVDSVATTCQPAGIFVTARCAIRTKRHFSSGSPKHGLTTTVGARQGIGYFIVACINSFILVVTGWAAATAIANGTDSFVHLFTMRDR